MLDVNMLQAGQHGDDPPVPGNQYQPPAPGGQPRPPAVGGKRPRDGDDLPPRCGWTLKRAPRRTGAHAAKAEEQAWNRLRGRANHALGASDYGTGHIARLIPAERLADAKVAHAYALTFLLLRAWCKSGHLKSLEPALRLTSDFIAQYLTDCGFDCSDIAEHEWAPFDYYFAPSD